MTRRLLVAAALIVAFGAFFLSNPPRAAYHGRAMGLIEHRGQFYRFEDLMNPEYQATSDDPFVQTFAEPRHFAIPWAGKGDPRENLSDLQLRRQEIWRGGPITIDIHDIEAIQESARTIPLGRGRSIH